MQFNKFDIPLPDTLQAAGEGDVADWYFGDEDEALARFEAACSDGTLKVMQGDQEVTSKSATIYLPPSEMELAEQQAKVLGVDTTTYLARLVRMGIHQKSAA